MSGPDGACRTLNRVVAGSVAPQPWRNGGGRTRELLAWPSRDDWTLRISLADIETDGPFSVFPGVTRWFTVVEGAGVTLTFDGVDHHVHRGAAPWRFDGGLGPGCRLIDGPTRDLNLMLRAGSGAMRAVEPHTGWAEPFVVRGLYSAVAGRWSAGDASLEIDASTLLWSEGGLADASPWHFAAAATDVPVAAWWLGFTPTATEE